MKLAMRSLVALAGAAAIVTTAQAQTVTLRMQSSWPSASTLQDHFRLLAERVDRLSGGSLRIDTLAAGQVVPPFEVLDATNKRVIDGSHTWAGYWTGRNRAAILFTGGPGGGFGMDMMDALGWLQNGGGLDLYRAFYDDLKLNVVPLPTLPAGPQAFGWFKRPVRNLADMKGMKCRQTGLAAEIWNRMGMTTVNMPGGEIIPSAQRGVIDCAEFVGGIEDLRLGFHNVWKFKYVPGMHEVASVGELIVNGDAWRGLTPLHREIMQSAANEAFLVWWLRIQKQNADAIEELTKKHGVQVLRTPPDILTEFLKAWDAMAAEEAAKNPTFRRVYDSQRAYASVVVPSKRFLFPPYSFTANHYWPEQRPAKPAAAPKK